MSNRLHLSEQIAGVGYVLAGGSSSRMGKDKAFIRLAGVPLLERAINCVGEVVTEVAVIGLDAGKLASVTCYPDLIRGQGPLGGIRTGLERSSSDRVLFCPCDCPLLPGRIFSILQVELEKGLLAVPQDSAGRVHPLIGVYRRTCLKPLERYLEGGRFSAMGFLDSLQDKARVVDVAKHGVPDRAFLNVNTLKSLEEARRWIR